MDYPKIETLYVRDEKTHKVTSPIRMREFTAVSTFLVTEKVDGTNIQVHLHPDSTRTFGGRTESASIPAKLFQALERLFPPEKVAAAFDHGTEAILFGEGYGAGIQKGGVYRPDPSFRLFDVVVLGPNDKVYPPNPKYAWWLEWENIEDVAKKLGIQTVPVLGHYTLQEAVKLVVRPSQVAVEENPGVSAAQQEGIVCRTSPLLFTRSGQRVMWKLKGRDF